VEAISNSAADQFVLGGSPIPLIQRHLVRPLRCHGIPLPNLRGVGHDDLDDLARKATTKSAKNTRPQTKDQAKHPLDVLDCQLGLRNKGLELQ
jgi:hypothetical protein